MLRLILKALTAIAIKLLSETVITELILFTLKRLSLMSKTKVDDGLYQIVEKALRE